MTGRPDRSPNYGGPARLGGCTGQTATLGGIFARSSPPPTFRPFSISLPIRVTRSSDLRGRYVAGRCAGDQVVAGSSRGTSPMCSTCVADSRRRQWGYGRMPVCYWGKAVVGTDPALPWHRKSSAALLAVDSAGTLVFLSATTFNGPHPWAVCSRSGSACGPGAATYSRIRAGRSGAWSAKSASNRAARSAQARTRSASPRGRAVRSVNQAARSGRRRRRTSAVSAS